MSAMTGGFPRQAQEPHLRPMASRTCAELVGEHDLYGAARVREAQQGPKPPADRPHDCGHRVRGRLAEGSEGPLRQPAVREAQLAPSIPSSRSMQVRAVRSGHGQRCPSKEVNGDLLERAVWADVESFLRSAGVVIELLQQRSDSKRSQEHLGRLEDGLTAKITER